MENNCIVLFKVLYYDEVSGDSKTECGFTFADDFIKAAEYLERHLYGDNLMQILHLELFDTCPVLSEELWTAMRKELIE